MKYLRMDSHTDALRVNRLCLVLLVVFAASSVKGTTISSVDPLYIGFKGDVRITIYGSGFAESQFSFGDGNEDLGNYVELVNNHQSYPCEIHKDGTTPTQIQCYTSPMPTEDDYRVSLKVNGVQVPDSSICNGNPWNSDCYIRTRTDKTPYFDEFEPRTGPPDQLVRMCGKMFTDYFGSNRENATNGRLQTIKRMTMSGYLLNHIDPDKVVVPGVDDGTYYLKLKSDSSDFGCIEAKIDKSSFVGIMNPSIVMSAPYGRAWRKNDIVWVTRKQECTTYQSRAELIGLSHSEGSTEGGTKLCIQGKFLQNPMKLYIAGVDVTPYSVTDGEVCVLSPPELTSICTKCPGNRGAIIDLWEGSEYYDLSLNEVRNITDNATASYHPDSLHYYFEDGMDYFVTRAKGFFLPPGDSDYKFCIYSDDSSAFYFGEDPTQPNNLVKVANLKNARSSYGLSSQCSDRIYLQKDKMYPYVMVMKEIYGAAYVHVGVKMFNTHLTSANSSQVQDETQKIKITTIQAHEEQTLNFVNWPSSSQSSTQECQSIEITSTESMSSVEFRVVLDGVQTVPLTGSSSASDIEDALDNIPSVYPDSTTVTTSSITDGTQINVCFNSDRGSFSEMEVTQKMGNITWSVTRTSVGVSNMDTIVLQFNGRPSQPLSFASLNANKLTTALHQTIGVGCPHDFLNPSNSKMKFYEDFEPSPSDRNYDYSSGSHKYSKAAFCGRGTMYSPKYLHKQSAPGANSFEWIQAQYLCFGYVFYDGGHIDKVHFQVIKPNGAETYKRWFPDTTLDSPDGEWNYICIDMSELDTSSFSRSSKYMKYIKLFTSSDDYSIDQIYIGNEVFDDMEGLIMHRRLRPSRYPIKEITTTGSKEEGFHIDFTPISCQNTFPPITLYRPADCAEVNGNTTECIGNGWPADVVLRSVKVQEATFPIGGTFNLTYENSTRTGLPYDIGGTGVADVLAMLGAGQCTSSQSMSCDEITYTITFKEKGGDREPLQIGSDLTGSDIQVEVTTPDNGYLFYDPIPGDMLRTMHATPQVIMDINDIPSYVNVTNNMDFSWSSDMTPTLSSIAPVQGSDGDTIIISGTGFSADVAGNEVVIGGTTCTVTAATDTQISCTAGQGPAGMHPVVVNVLSKGWPTQPPGGALNFTYQFLIDSFSPNSSCPSGGATLNITGNGFGDSVMVTVGNSECDVILATYEEVLCIIPQNLSASEVDVTISDDNGNSYTSPSRFTYDNSSAAIVSGIGPSYVAPINGGVSITVTGSNFGSEEGTVTICETSTVIESWSDTEVVLELPDCPAGSYPVLIVVPGCGYVDLMTHSISNLEYKLGVSGIVPLVGSMEGGSVLTITGEGFGEDASVVQVSLGGDVTCELLSVNDSTIICTVIRPCSGNIVRNTNYGYHPVYGRGYAWDYPHIDLRVGECVNWVWSVPPSVEGYAYMVQQTVDELAEEYDGTGFKSTTASRGTANGAFQHQFTEPGLYQYWTGCVDTSCTIIMRGEVHVQEALPSAANIVVTVAGEIAQQTVSAGQTLSNCTDDCPGAEGPITTIPGCPMNESLSCDNSTSHCFVFDPCYTPRVTMVNMTQGSSIDVIAVTGHGIGAELCRNTVLFGDEEGTVLSVEADGFLVTMNTATTALVGTCYWLGVSVCNLGNALISVEDLDSRQFCLMPHVSSITPTEGSTKGDTLVTIEGGGFTESSSVSINNLACNVPDDELITYNRIVCKSPQGSNSNTARTLGVTVYQGGQNFGALCQTPGSSCGFKYLTSQTPVVDSVSPSELTLGGHEVTIAGSNLGSNSENVTVLIGESVCGSVSVNAAGTSVSCVASAAVDGTQDFYLHVRGMGKASSSVASVEVTCGIASLSQSTGSTAGGLALTVLGYGFDLQTTVITVDGASWCSEYNITDTKSITCTTPPGTGAVDVTVTSNEASCGSEAFTFSGAATPDITSTSPASGFAGTTLTIAGTGFSGGSVTVSLGDADCPVSTSSGSSIECVVSEHPAGEADIVVNVQTKGIALGNYTFAYLLAVDSISIGNGSFGGGLIVTVEGNGFDSADPSVLICDQECEVVAGSMPNSTHIQCETPPNQGSGILECAVTVKSGTESVNMTGTFTYDDNLTPTITEVSPRRGGTGGGTRITISGTGFICAPADNTNTTISLAGTVCVIDESSCTATQIECVTGPHKPSIETQVLLNIEDRGNALQVNASYEYIDVWSSIYTWGGTSIPEEGDFVVVPSDMKILLDVDTPVLSMLLIRGGQLIFDEVDVHLNSKNILITDGGLLQVGTEEEPFQHNAVIEMHGQLREPELPVYGAKTLAVREGKLELHGIPKIPWTVLGETAEAGDTQITLSIEADWEVGNSIAIASTGGRSSQKQNEERQIVAITSTDSRSVITLNEALEYRHLGEVVDIDEAGEFTLEARAEVGLLTRNVIVRGDNDPQWNDVIPACPVDFDTGEFATQNCFQGRFGEEIGSDQYGSQIMLSAPTYHEWGGEKVVEAHIENIEITYAGQAFRKGRYAIHFHLNGDMNGTYVRGCAIHQSFNRAVNIHGSHNVLIENNIIYDIMGGAFFLEDGVETGNIIQYNVGIFIKGSSSLQNDDVTPAVFWLTNPTNIVQHNRAAGGTHFGIWYRMKNEAEGPSLSEYPHYNPTKQPLGVFFNNTIHDQGWFGLWLFEDYFPTVDGDSSSTDYTAAVFDGLTVWNCEMGSQFFFGGAVQYNNSFLVNNKDNGIEGKWLKKMKPFSDTAGPKIMNSVVAATDHAGRLDPDGKGKWGIILPYEQGIKLENVTFINFNTTYNSGEESYALRIAFIVCISQPFNGGFRYKTRGLRFVNSDNRIHSRWQHEFIIVDEDGSFSEAEPYSKVVPDMGTLPPDNCTAWPYTGNTSMPLSVCDPSIDFHRVSLSEVYPSSLKGKDINITDCDSERHAISKFQEVRIISSNGWMFLALDGHCYNMQFVEGEHFTNISYDAILSTFEGDECVIIKHDFNQRIDRVQVMPGSGPTDPVKDAPISCGTHCYGDYHYDNVTNDITYIVNTKDDCVSKRRKRDLVASSLSKFVDFNVYQCFFEDCAVPLAPEVIDAAPEDARLWSHDSTWNYNSEDSQKESATGDVDGTSTKPTSGEIVAISSGEWVILDETTPELDTLYIYGTLEFINDNSSSHIVLKAKKIFVDGGGALIIGRENQPYLGTAEIYLMGTAADEEMLFSGDSGPVVGTKAIGVFGTLNMHGKPLNSTWVRLSTTAEAGSSTLHVEEPIYGWNVGDQIILSPTDYDPDHTEVLTISNIGSDLLSLTVTSPLLYTHLSTFETMYKGEGGIMQITAEVGLLTRNVKITGEELFNDPLKTEFGARVLIGKYAAMADGIFRESKGVAKLSNVEWTHFGQEGYTDTWDPRHGLSFLNLGANSDSYVSQCSFHHGYSPAISIYTTDNINVTNNVIYQTIRQGIITNGGGMRIVGNLVTGLIWSGGIYDPVDVYNTDWEAGIDISAASDVILRDNVVAGCQRAGFAIQGEPCTDEQVMSADQWTGNIAHSVVIGVYIMRTALPKCARISHFSMFKTFSYGVYAQTTSSIEVVDVNIVDSHVAVMTFIVGPSASSHQRADKYTMISRTNIVAQSSSFDCDSDVIDRTTPNYRAAGTGISFGAGSDSGHYNIGVVPGTFSSSNMAPGFGFAILMGFPSIAGLTIIDDVAFVNFGINCRGNRDYAIKINKNQNDIQHPTRVSNIRLVDVDTESKFQQNFPSKSSIGVGIDMPTDGFKKVLLDDIDGTFTGRDPSGSDGGACTLISKSEYMWNDLFWGTGDNRIPTTMLTDTDGTRLYPQDIKSDNGVVRDSSCTWVEEWRAYSCCGYDYEMVIIESLDPDSLTRRLSPIAMVCDGHLDLINGPSKRNWGERLSIFPIVAPVGKYCRLFMTGTVPQNIRIHLLNADSTKKVHFSLWYFVRQRLDIYKNSIYMAPTNAELDSNGQQVLSAPSFEGEFVPDVSTHPGGTNYFDSDTGELHFLVDGDFYIDINMSPVIIVTFTMPAMTVDEFFGEQIISNLALFLGIPESKIKIANAVSESRRRRKRQVETEAAATMDVEVQISNEPSANQSAAADPDSLSFDALESLSSNLSDPSTLPALSSSLGVEILEMAVVEPIAPADDSRWNESVAEMDDGLWDDFNLVAENTVDTNVIVTVIMVTLVVGGVIGGTVLKLKLAAAKGKSVTVVQPYRGDT